MAQSPPNPSKRFYAIPLHINPSNDGMDDIQEEIPWLCDLSLLASANDPTSIFAIGLDDPEIHRFMFCTSLCVTVKERMLIHDAHDAVLALQHQRSFAMLRRQQNSSIGRFLHLLSLSVSADKRLCAVMLADEEDDEDASMPSNDSVLTLTLYFDLDSIITPIARTAGIVSPTEEIEFISLSFQFSRTARAAHVASLALMMAAHSRLGISSLLGQMLGTDVLRVICDMYRLRLYECRKHVWNE
jgi:hypothetical protein